MRTDDLRTLGQKLWLDDLSRDLLDNGFLCRCIRDYSITGITSNPSIFDAALAGSHAYDTDITELARSGKSGESIFEALALHDLRQAADLFRPMFDHTGGLDGWVSVEVSPLLANDAESSIDAAKQLHARIDRPNLLVKIPGTSAGLIAIEAAIASGIPVNVTLLFSKAHYEQAAQAYMRGLEQRLAAGLDLNVASVASIFISRWDAAVVDRVPANLQSRLGIAIGGQVYAAHRELLETARWRRLRDAGARPQRLLWASTGNRNPEVSDTCYVDALLAPGTINTLSEKTLTALIRADAATPLHQPLFKLLTRDGVLAAAWLSRFKVEGIDVDVIARQLQNDGVRAFVNAWQSLLARIDARIMA